MSGDADTLAGLVERWAGAVVANLGRANADQADPATILSLIKARDAWATLEALIDEHPRELTWPKVDRLVSVGVICAIYPQVRHEYAAGKPWDRSWVLQRAETLFIEFKNTRDKRK